MADGIWHTVAGQGQQDLAEAEASKIQEPPSVPCLPEGEEHGVATLILLSQVNY